MELSKKVECFNGKGDVNAFIVKIELHSKLKNYVGENAAVFLASRLQEPAFNVYMRMSEEDRKDVEKIKTELKKQYEVGNRDREEALQLLSSAQRKQGETAQDFNFRIGELVKLAYPTFDHASRLVHEKDAYVRGLHPDMQMKIKTLENFTTLDMKGIVDNTVRLEVAGVKSACKPIKEEISMVQHSDTPHVSPGFDQLLSRMDCLEEAVSKISVGDNRSRPKYNRSSQRQDAASSSKKGCWNCGDPSHVLRRCPKRFCPACGKQGHDVRDKMCSKSS